MQITVLSSYKCEQHVADPEHPECPARLHQIKDQLIASGLEYVVHFQQATAATQQDLCLAHSPEYVDKMFRIAPADGSERLWLDDDTIMMDRSLNAALYAAGAARDAVDLVMQSGNQLGFCNVRPPGHHAGIDSASGFCLFNNAAIAAKYAVKKYKLERVAIVDFDVHHGNGTEEIVQHDPRIMLCSSFQHPFYPFSGDGPTAENVKNVLVPAGTKGADYRELMQSAFVELDAFAPQLVVVSAGFDAHAEDALGQLRLVESDYLWLANEIKQLMNRHAQGRCVAVLEGGYALSALSRSVVAFLNGFIS